MSARSRRFVPDRFRVSRPRGRHARPRRGVILMVVLSLLVLFTLIAITFVILSTQHKKTALSDQKPLRYDDGYSELLTRAVMQALRGTDNPNSIIGHHSLLEDMYGNDSIAARIPSLASGDDYDGFSLGNQAGYDTSAVAGVVSLAYIDVPLPSLVPASTFRPVAGYYNGRVLSMLTGAAAGKSTRIVAYGLVNRMGGLPGDPPDTGRIVFMPFEGMRVDTALPGWSALNAPQVGDRFLINGRPFNGAGFGFNPINGQLDAADGHTLAREYALLPFPPNRYDTNGRYGEYQAYLGALGGENGISPDEDYDAVDFNNMLLAARVQVGGRWVVQMPSLVRPDLINYWAQRYIAAGEDPSVPLVAAELLSQTFPRPLPFPFAHPAFDGGNPAFQAGMMFDATIAQFSQDTLNSNGILDIMETRPWDVDNDGDDDPDSVWVDLGMPVQTAPDGRRYKPLFALLVTDMDSRPNLNAHGGPYDFVNLPEPFFNQPLGANGESEGYIFQNDFGNYYLAGGVPTANYTTLPVGSGTSAADVNLGAVLPQPYIPSAPGYPMATGNTTVNEYRRLLQGGYPLDPHTGDPDVTQPIIEGRYGEAHLYSDGSGRLPQAGRTSSVVATSAGLDGTTGTADDLYDGDDNLPPAPVFAVPGWGRLFSGNLYRDGFFYNLPLGDNGTPTDLDGNGTVALDLNGRPIFIYMGQQWPFAPLNQPEGVDEPFEIDLFRTAVRAMDGATDGQQQSIDSPFTPNELERLLRFRDADARTLPDRIARLAPFMANNALFRGLFTTESWDTPCPPVRLTPELLRRRNGADLLDPIDDDPALVAALPSMTNLSLVDLLAARIIVGMTPQPVPPFTPAQQQVVNTSLAQMLAPELAAGLRLDINRLLGDGIDNNGNGVVDEPDEAIYPETIWNNSGISPGPRVFDHNNDGNGGLFDPMDPSLQYRTDMLARHMLARQLYVLMMLLTDSGYALRPQSGSADSGLNDAQRHELTARRIAQWAINVVDFRDRDSIMTPFEYDADPFTDGNGDGLPWDVDGWLGVNPVTGVSDDDISINTHRRLVWGCEYPDLLITETLAFHDRRTEDLTTPGGKYLAMAGTNDPHYDQRRIPQGSAFIELHSTRNPNNPAYSGDVCYHNAANLGDPLNGMLDLGKMAPPNVTHGGASPVWRLAVTYPHQDTALPEDGPDNDLATRFTASATTSRPLSTTNQPENMNALNGIPAGSGGLATPEQPINIERIVWMSTTQPPAGHPDISRIYYNRATGTADTPVLLPSGGYAVVGPHRAPDTGPENITAIGRRPAPGTPDDAQRIELGNAAGVTGVGTRGPVEVTGNTAATAGSYPTIVVNGTGDIRAPIGIPVGAVPASPTWPSTSIGFSISEPLFSNNYYTPDPDTATTIDYQGVGSVTYTDAYSSPVDVPFDNDPNRPLGRYGLPVEGTSLNFSTVILQRLADPTRAWNPESTQFDAASNTFVPDARHNPDLPVNPYISIDSMPFDLTVFEGEYTTTAGDMPQPGVGSQCQFMTRQRGDQKPPAVSTYDLWSATSSAPTNSSPDAAANVPFKDNLDVNVGHTLGFINYTYHSTGQPSPYYTSATLPANYPADQYAGSPYPNAGGPTFPWLTWNNRPYASALELLQVPASSPGRLLFEFDWRHQNDPGNGTPGARFDHYREVNGSGLNGPPFGHLLSMMYSSSTDHWNNDPLTTTPNPPTATSARSNYHRVLDYIGVPSRFSGTEDLLNPFAEWGDGPNSLPFHPPFNRVSKYREPGKININTIFDDGRTWRAIMNRHVGDPGYPYPFDAEFLWNKVVASRRGYGPSLPIAGIFNNASPTIFANPFRANNYSYPDLIPALQYRNVDASSARRESVESGLLRPDPDEGTRPLFGISGAATANVPWSVHAEPYRDADRNPHFAYKELQKLDNILTTRSNVYAIWITVGYFEVAPVPVDAFHPDGYTLGPEIGSDSGEIVRHRAFFLFDRSIPVAFERGRDHNVQKALLIQRIIE
jgi:hypothetical protein